MKFAESGAEQISSPRAEGSLFSISAISSHLQNLNYPQKSIDSMLKCGSVTGQMIKVCPECGPELINLKHHCNLRTCPECSKIRKRRIFKRYLPFLKKYKNNQKDFLYFLTISPKNYSSLEEGLKHIRKSFNKFLRLSYVKDRIKAGIYVIESKNSDDVSWNVHIHAIVYGRWLDNKIRGKCLDCGQNFIKFDYINKRFYCGSRRCNSLNVVHNEDSQIVSLWKKCSFRDVNIRIERLCKNQYRQQTDVNFTLNYMLKYVSSNKDDFSSSENMAKYIFFTRKMKLINTFGLFFKLKPDKVPNFCFKCGSPVEFIFDYDAVELMKKAQIPPPKDILTSWG